METLPRDLQNVTARATAATVQSAESVQSILDRLERVKQRLLSTDPDGAASELAHLQTHVQTSSTKATEKHKEWSSHLTKLGKAVDKRFATPLSSLFPKAGVPFSSPESKLALCQTISMHLARLGLFLTHEAFQHECDSADPWAKIEYLHDLYHILAELGEGRVEAALTWLDAHPGVDDEADLEFDLRREEFLRLLLSDSDLSGATEPLLPPTASDASSSSSSPAARAALAYGGVHFRRLYTPTRSEAITSLLASPLYLPFSHLLASPYRHLFEPYLGPTARPTPLQLRFSDVYFRSLAMPMQSGLGVVVDVAPLAVGRIMKVDKVMKDKRTEWSDKGELPVEIPLPSEQRYHSIFACPVSKEQATESNPPMLLPCGHVIAKESLQKLGRGTQTLKCPYCPIVSQLSAAVRIHF